LSNQGYSAISGSGNGGLIAVSGYSVYALQHAQSDKRCGAICAGDVGATQGNVSAGSIFHCQVDGPAQAEESWEMADIYTLSPAVEDGKRDHCATEE
jgi:hypothetical protein